ncbi:cobalt-precorrin-5B (C(1))-methyltransferase CbiD [Citroniella saccharovorans]|uniref:Cobalt-precorrin-5B C(1)-methyltransferase n=1 Tax=Citroniella saccharovorans TaxID=2053367 RepID=A0AAW9MS67_9FIRM|nr:cobalt-precorrin-5B (C(1))-methyltransferase CbiD [Citroniella saccharovorans]MEB3428996.1 cobalt-precorrin-5B (C(1))-methyltransferase CbiD [Citroniella saccharovorans]
MKKLELYKNNLRCGYTTGSTAEAAVVAACNLLLYGEKIKFVKINTPSSYSFEIEIESFEIRGNKAIASAIKDGGDDKDATSGLEIFAELSENNLGENRFFGGKGIGIIKKKNLFGKIGDPAINPMPRKMIDKRLREDFPGHFFDITIFAPRGEEVAKKTYNKNFGIEGGISIIGTSGIVEPMSLDALLKTIYIEIDTLILNGEKDRIVFVPGSYGERFAKDLFLNPSLVQVSNYMGDALTYAYEKNVRDFKLLGHIGKFSKLALGAFNTHNKVCDLRLESFVYYMAKRGIYDFDTIESFTSSEEAANYLIENSMGFILDDMERGIEKRIKTYLKDDDIKVRAYIYTMEKGIKR